MQLISCIDELSSNLHTLESYMHSAIELERKFHRDLIKKGVCFVAYQRNGQDYFAPSRFIGYKSNDHGAHVSNASKDGRETNPAISDILCAKPVPDDDLNISYMRFCTRIGVAPVAKGSFGVERKYWILPVAA
jgi:hypothetical protein